MNTISNPAQSEFSKGSLPVKRSLVEKLAIDPADLKNGRSGERPRLGKRLLPVLAAIMLCIGVGATLAWLSYGDAARKAIASSFPRLDRLAPQVAPVAQNASGTFAPADSAAPFPDPQQLSAMSLDLDEVRQSVDRIANSIATAEEHMTQSVDRIAASQEQITRTVDQLAASQERMTREITKLQAIGQYILYKNSEPPAPRSSQGRTAR